MLFPSFAAILPAFLAFGVVASSAAPLISVAPISVKVNAKAQGSATDIVSSLKTVTDSLLASVTSKANVPGGLPILGGLDILSQLTTALTSATGGLGGVPALPTNPTSAVSSLAPLVTQILSNVTGIVAKLSTLPLLGPLLAPVQALLTSLVASLLPVAGGTLPSVPTLPIPSLPSTGGLGSLLPGLGGLLPRVATVAA